MNNKKAISHLISSKPKLLKYLKGLIKSENFSYINFGTAVEPFVQDKFIEIFTEGGFIKEKSDYRKAPHKNYFPDFTLLSTKPPLAIDIKAGNHSTNSKRGWVRTNNSENDLGTLNMWPKKLKEFGGDNMFFAFIEYDFTDKKQEIVDVKIEPFYSFLDLRREGVLKYRLKDGNLRPRNYNTAPKVKTLSQFSKLLDTTIVFHRKKSLEKYLNKMPQEERKAFLEDQLKS